MDFEEVVAAKLKKINLRRYPPELRGLRTRLARVLRWLRRSEIFALSGFAVMASFTVDFLLEIPVILRLLLLFGFVFLVIRSLRRASRRDRYDVLSSDLLQSVEECYDDLDGQLMNHTELDRELRQETPFDQDKLKSHLLRRALDESRAAIEDVRYETALNTRPLYKQFGVASLALLILFIFATQYPSNFGHWFRRNILLSNETWPRGTHYAFKSPGNVRRQARGDPFEIEAWVLGEIPRSVQIHFESESGTRSSRLLPGAVKVKKRWAIASTRPAGAPGYHDEVEGHRLLYNVASVQEPFKFYFSGGDNESESINVRVKDRPVIETVRFNVRPPTYLDEPERIVENPAGEISVPSGSLIDILLICDQPIHEATYEFTNLTPFRLELLDEKRAQSSFKIPKSGFLEFSVTGKGWKLKSHPRRYAFVSLPDRIPDARLELEGENRLYTPRGVVSYRVEGEDDHGFNAMELKISVIEPNQAFIPDETEGAKTDLFIDLSPWTVEPVEDGVRAAVSRDLELSELQLEYGSRVVLQAVVSDNDEPAGFKTGYSQKETIRILRAETLREEVDRLRVEIQTQLENLAEIERTLANRAANDRATPRKIEDNQQQETDKNSTEELQLADARDPNESSEKNSRQDTPANTEDDSRLNPRESADLASQENETKNPTGALPEDLEKKSKREDAKSPSEKKAAKRDHIPSNQRDSRREHSRDKASNGQNPLNGKKQDLQPANEQSAPESLEEVAQRQKQLTQEMQQLAEKAQEMTRTLERSRILSEEEKRRAEEEIHKPLEELIKEALPRSSATLDKMSQSDPSPQDRSRAQKDMNRIARNMEEVAKRLGQTENFREVLQRMKQIIDLQEQVIKKTRKDAEAEVNETD